MLHRLDRRRLVPLMAVALSLMAPATASATDLFASPTGSSASGNDCTDSAAPCSIERAINTVAQSGDDVTLLGTAYTTSTPLGGVSAFNLTVHGEPGARPTITFTTASPGENAILLQSGSLLRDVVVDASGAMNNGSAVSVYGGTVERVSAHDSRFDAVPCGIGGGTIMRDSTCWDTGGSGGTNSSAINVSSQGPGDTATLRNVTAVSTGSYGIRSVAAGSFGVGQEFTMALTATNVIARGGGVAGQEDVTTDVFAGGGADTVTLAHSNYATESEQTSGDITDPGSGTNRTTAPAFVNAGAGDFHQTSGSTGTLNLGTATGLQPLQRDFDGQYRNQGSAPDIGADEFAVAPLAPTLTGTNPASGANDNNPKVLGSAEPLSTVTLYPNGTCAVTAAATDTAEVFASPGIPASVLDNTITTFSATATNSAGPSPCSTVNVTYSEVTPLPPPPPPAVTTTTTTGQRAAALKKCKKKPKGKKRKKCRKRAKRLPV